MGGCELIMEEFTDDMDAMMLAKQDEHGDDWKNLGVDELILLAEEHAKKARYAWMDGGDVKKHLIHAANYLRLAYFKGA